MVGIPSLGCSTSFGMGQLHIIRKTMCTEIYQEVFKQNINSSVKELNLGQTWVRFQLDKGPKHSSKSAKECLKRKNIGQAKVLT